MKARLNVTEAERLCYSRRKLQAISALQNVGINPGSYGMHKDYRVLGVKGKVYLVEHADGTIYHFTRLVDIHAYVAEYQVFQRQRAVPDWRAWRDRFKLPKLPLAACAWPDCPYPATTWLKEDALCGGHAFIYEVMLEERKKRRASEYLFPALTWAGPLSAGRRAR